MKKKSMSILAIVAAIIFTVIGALFIGHTKIDMTNGFHVSIERPVTMALFIFMIIASLFKM